MKIALIDLNYSKKSGPSIFINDMTLMFIALKNGGIYSEIILSDDNRLPDLSNFDAVIVKNEHSNGLSEEILSWRVQIYKFLSEFDGKIYFANFDINSWLESPEFFLKRQNLEVFKPKSEPIYLMNEITDEFLSRKLHGINESQLRKIDINYFYSKMIYPVKNSNPEYDICYAISSLTELSPVNKLKLDILRKVAEFKKVKISDSIPINEMGEFLANGKTSIYFSDNKFNPVKTARYWELVSSGTGIIEISEDIELDGSNVEKIAYSILESLEIYEIIGESLNKLKNNKNFFEIHHVQEKHEEFIELFID